MKRIIVLCLTIAPMGAFAAAPAGVFVDDDGTLAEKDAVEGAGRHALRIAALHTVYGLGDVAGAHDADARRKIVAVRLHGKDALARMADDAGGHAGIAANAQLRVDFDVFIHGFLL